ncbi:50S ribosomal protein L11 methyltransferase [Catellatospora tritici]|uniref:50S ribosomal protein L11 methyltransferase n=1 Tax=Catellatospora tritici TaxID=2851566 RepID=UPI001C2D8542|nr:50S ribosomal protein L11 methyltransferase [Catellatospora tritici]MBV1850598.1 50S ribosomal protein L11 methyltransferase [Catellatospora tritici]
MTDSTASASVATKAAIDKAFTTYDIQACLYDARRVQYLQEAINKTVKPGDVAVDAGSGTGLLGLFAAKAGAKRVYCLEFNPDFIPVIEENARRNGLADRIIAVHADATSHELPEEVDVVISEVISAGFFYEPQLQITNNLRRFLKPGGAMIPMGMQNHVELMYAQEDIYGLKLNFDTRFTELDDDRPLTDSPQYLDNRFDAWTDPAIRGRARLTAMTSGRANAIRIAYRIDFAEGISGDKPTDFLLNPQIIFLQNSFDVRAGDQFDVSLDYLASNSPLEANIAITPIKA